MVATHKGGRGKAGKQRGRRAAAGEGNAAAATAPADTGSVSARRCRAADEPRPIHVKVGSRDAGAWIRALADTSETLEARRRLRRLAGQVVRGSGNAQRMTFLETEIAECLDEAAACAGSRDRWQMCEAATWALGWMARAKRAGGSAGGLLERIVQQARRR